MTRFRSQLRTAILLTAIFVLFYGGTNQLTALRSDVHTCYAQWELQIPLMPWTLIPYLSLDAIFIASFFTCLTRTSLRTLSMRMADAIILAAICFLLFPLRLGYAKSNLPGIAGAIFHYLGDHSQFNAAPSLHIALGTILLAHFIRIERTRWLRIVTAIWFALIGASTLLTHQHHLIDLPAGFFLAAFCMWMIPQRRPRQQSSAISPTIGWRYALGGLVCLVIPSVIGGWFWLLAWPALSLLLVAATYFGWIDDVYRKRHGRLPWSTHVILAPVLIGTWLWRWPQRRNLPAPIEISPGVVIGHRLNRNEIDALQSRSVRAVLDLTPEISESPAFLSRSIRYRNVAILDWTLPTASQLSRAVEFISARISRGETVYVHCAMGYSRTAHVIADYLVRSGRCESMETALSQFSRARFGIEDRPERPIRRLAMRVI